MQERFCSAAASYFLFMKLGSFDGLETIFLSGKSFEKSEKSFEMSMFYGLNFTLCTVLEILRDQNLFFANNFAGIPN